MLKKTFAFLAPIFGFLFLNAYIKNAALDVVYTDYIRLVNSYLKDVYSLKPYMSKDILTRIPVNYIQRIINVELFGYSTSFDMFLGALFLALSAAVLLNYMQKKELSLAYMLAAFIIIFSLNKWEMLTNGSGWVHFLALLLFYINFCIEDSSLYVRESKVRQAISYILPVFTVLFVAGPYSVAYAISLILIYVYKLFFCIQKKEKTKVREYLLKLFLISFLLILFLLSNAAVSETHSGASSESFFTVFKENKAIIMLLFMKSFAAILLGVEYIDKLLLTESQILLLSLIIIITYIYVIYLNIKFKIYEKSILPLTLIIYGGLNHVMVTASRWIFLRSEYAMSSRYTLQYQAGILGILFTFALYKKLKDKQEKGRKKSRLMSYNKINYILILIIISGNILTTKDELNKAKARLASFQIMYTAALNFENESDEDLKKIFQYRSGEKTREALELLKEKKLNVFRTED